MSVKRVLFRHAAALLLCFSPALAAKALAEPDGGRVTGRVVDVSGGVLSGATITLRGGPGAPRRTQTDGSGRFEFAGVSAGLFTVTVSRSGFGEVTMNGVELAAGPVELSDITLRLAAFDEAVVVSATRVEQPPQWIPDEHLGGDRHRHRAAGHREPHRAGTLDARPDRGRPGRARQQRHHRPGPQHGLVERIRVHGQQLQQRRRHLPRRHPPRDRSPAARHRAGGGAARAAGDALRRRHAGGGGALPAAAARHGAAHVRGPRRPVRAGARRRAGLRRRRHLQPAARRTPAGAARFHRPLRRPRLHRLRLPAANAGGLRAGAGHDRSRGGGGQPAERARRQHRGDGLRAAVAAVAADPGAVRPVRLPPAGPAGRRTSDQPRPVVRHRPLRRGAPLPGAERPQERALEPGS